MNKNIWKCGRHIFELGKRTYIMGILNVTPDSFSDGGRFLDPDIAVQRAAKIQAEGADIIDIGAQSTRPGYSCISSEEELKRIVPVLKKIIGKINIPISIDTFYPSVAYEAINMGVDIINDVMGLKDIKMLEVLSSNDCGYVIMHDGSASSINKFFLDKLNQVCNFGICPERICFDPGIGFGKTYDENIYVLKNIKKFKIQQNALLVGASRKRVIGQSCGNPPFKDRMAGTVAAHTISILGGANIIRVHDVAEAVQAAKVTDRIILIGESAKCQIK